MPCSYHQFQIKTMSPMVDTSVICRKIVDWTGFLVKLVNNRCNIVVPFHLFFRHPQWHGLQMVGQPGWFLDIFWTNTCLSQWVPLPKKVFFFFFCWVRARFLGVKQIPPERTSPTKKNSLKFRDLMAPRCYRRLHVKQQQLTDDPTNESPEQQSANA